MLCLFQTAVVHGDMRNFLYHSEHNNQRMLQKPSAFESEHQQEKLGVNLRKKQKKNRFPTNKERNRHFILRIPLGINPQHFIVEIPRGIFKASF